MLCLCICSMANFYKDEKGGQHGEDVVIFSVRVLWCVPVGGKLQLALHVFRTLQLARAETNVFHYGALLSASDLHCLPLWPFVSFTNSLIILHFRRHTKSTDNWNRLNGCCFQWMFEEIQWFQSMQFILLKVQVQFFSYFFHLPPFRLVPAVKRLGGRWLWSCFRSVAHIFWVLTFRGR